MANTYSQIYLHFVFAVQNRPSLIGPEWASELHKYMNGIIENNGQKAYIVNGMADHVHALVSMNPKQAPSDLMHDVKQGSSLWVNKNHLVMGKFSWQEGFGVFSYGSSQIPAIYKYIENQKEHHKKRTFMEEYILFLKLFNVDYDERYIYKPLE